MKIVASLAAGLVLLSANAAAACIFIPGPEPLGNASAEFIARRMVEAATYVDLAVAERAEQVRGGALPVYQVTYRVTKRLKGPGSPSVRFTLPSGGVLPDNPALRPSTPMMMVDPQSGEIYPFWHYMEPPEAGAGMTSCTPAIISTILGRTYLIFRGSDGRLLGPLLFHPGDTYPRQGYVYELAGPPADLWESTVRRLTK